MTTVSEQIQLYRALKAQQSPVANQQHDSTPTERQHPNTSEYFKLLMQRWQSDYMKKSR